MNLKSAYYALRRQLQQEHGIVWIGVYHMCISFSKISLPNYVHFLRNMGLALAYDFDDKLALLRQHILRTDKTTLSVHLAVSLKVSASSHETKRIITNMNK